MRKSVLVGALVVCALMVFSSSVVLAADNWNGTWKLNLAKSKCTQGPALKSLTLKFEATPAGTKLTADGVDADGKPMHERVDFENGRQGSPLGGQPERRHGFTQEGRRQHLHEHLEEGRQGDHDGEGRRIGGRQDPHGHPVRKEREG